MEPLQRRETLKEMTLGNTKKENIIKNYSVNDLLLRCLVIAVKLENVSWVTRTKTLISEMETASRLFSIEKTLNEICQKDLGNLLCVPSPILKKFASYNKPEDMEDKIKVIMCAVGVKKAGLKNHCDYIDYAKSTPNTSLEEFLMQTLQTRARILSMFSYPRVLTATADKVFTTIGAFTIGIPLAPFSALAAAAIGSFAALLVITHVASIKMLELWDKFNDIYLQNLRSVCSFCNISYNEMSSDCYALESLIVDKLDRYDIKSLEKLNTISAEILYQQIVGSDPDGTFWEKLKAIHAISSMNKESLLSFVKGVVCVYELRYLACKVFTTGIVGPMKCGKSTLIKKMGFPHVQATSAVNTDRCSLYCYGTSDSFFCVMDFPGCNDNDVGRVTETKYGYSACDICVATCDIGQLCSNDLTHVLTYLVMDRTTPIIISATRCDLAAKGGDEVDDGDEYVDADSFNHVLSLKQKEIDNLYKTTLKDSVVTKVFVSLSPKFPGFIDKSYGTLNAYDFTLKLLEIAKTTKGFTLSQSDETKVKEAAKGNQKRS